ncbi:uncharacterized protein YgbK (DUF1537 family) [Arcicella rosea]|uniref:four-carbon acid sugar kinase family protein n=1 Tax=Arcicella rosea TaxID=502909 RepID=UPI00345CDB1B
MANHHLLMAYYGDDFTGSTDALEFLSRAGAKTALFIEAPTATQLSAYSDLKAIGVAGLSRSMSPVQMEETLFPTFTALKALGVKHVHYKVCSTFDSSPNIGSIGKAIDVGASVFKNTCIPLLVAAPSLGRYCAFGNLFARMGIGSEGQIHRLDRHPSMSKHPVTPADESDLRIHLAKQTDKKIGLLDILQVAKPYQELKEGLKKQLEEQAGVLLIDAMYESQFSNIGRLLDELAEPDQPLFSVGSSGIEMALGKYWNEIQELQAVTTWEKLEKANPLLVIAGSCSPVTSRQISWALEHGFKEIIIDAQAICDTEINEALLKEYLEKAVSLAQNCHHLIIHTNGSKTNVQATLSSEKLGKALGLIAKKVVSESEVKRVVIAGGDTSSYAARAMKIEAVEMIAPLVAGAPVCKARSANPFINGIEVNFKGGQVGDERYFGILLDGKL